MVHQKMILVGGGGCFSYIERATPEIDRIADATQQISIACSVIAKITFEVKFNNSTKLCSYNILHADSSNTF